MAALAIEEVPQALTAAESRRLKALEGRIERGLATFKDVGLALLEVRDSHLYRASHPSFEAYCKERWNLERNRAYQFMGAAEVMQTLHSPEGLVNEAQARELVPVMNLDPARVPEVWAEVERRVEQEHRPVTAPLIREVVQTVVPIPGRPAVTDTDRLVALINRVTASFTTWRARKPSAAQRKRVNEAFAGLVEAAK